MAFGNKSFKDEMFEYELSKKYGGWDSRLKSARYRGAAVLVILVIGFIIIGISNEHDTNLSWDKVKTGSVLYVPDEFLKDTSSRVFKFNRMIRPINVSDIDTMQIPVAEKRAMAAQLDTKLPGPLMLAMSDIVISRDSMYKYGEASVGALVAKDSLTPVEGDTYNEKWYAIAPNNKLTEKGHEMQLPKGYVLANNNLYVRPYDVRLEQPSSLKKFEERFVAVKPPVTPVKDSIAKDSSLKDMEDEEKETLAMVKRLKSKFKNAKRNSKHTITRHTETIIIKETNDEN